MAAMIGTSQKTHTEKEKHLLDELSSSMAACLPAKTEMVIVSTPYLNAFAMQCHTMLVVLCSAASYLSLTLLPSFQGRPAMRSARYS